MAEPSHRAPIIAAVIGVVGSIAAALIANWDKFGGSSSRVETVPPTGTAVPDTRTVRSTDDATAVINIAGTWRDANFPSNGSRVTQVGNLFQFSGWGVLPQGIPFESTGSGTVSGQQLLSSHTIRYQSGEVSYGNCQGTVTADGSRTTSTCTDSVLGTFVSSGIRQ